MSCSCVMCHVSRGRVPSTCAHDSCRASLTSRNMADGKNSAMGVCPLSTARRPPYPIKYPVVSTGVLSRRISSVPSSSHLPRSSEVAQKEKVKHYAAGAWSS